MKKTVLTLLVALLVGGLANARQSLFETPNVSVTAEFYKGNPENGGVLLESSRLNNSPFARPLDGVRGHTFVVLEYEGETATFTTFPGGTTKNSIYLNLDGVTQSDTSYAEAREDATSIRELLNELAQEDVTLQELAN